MIQSLARGLEILDLLEQAEGDIGIMEFARYLDVDKSSASRLLQTLASYGYVEQNPDTRRFRLGPRVVVLSNRVLNRMPLRDHAHPFLRQLTDVTGECSHLAILSQGKALYIDQYQTPSILRVETEIGTLSPLHCTALGKVLLAFVGVPSELTLTPYTPRTIGDAETLRVHLDQVRRQGFAIDDEEHVAGVRCIAAPVYNFGKKVIAAIGISGPAGRVTLDNLPLLKQQVIATAEDLSRRLGSGLF
ncbi:MAG: IclR family transcriptional regulator [Chloroflexi bacterium]|nr:IclR family transcriptional regulator [Chloroflexota bacterium]